MPETAQTERRGKEGLTRLGTIQEMKCEELHRKGHCVHTRLPDKNRFKVKEEATIVPEEGTLSPYACWTGGPRGT